MKESYLRKKVLQYTKSGKYIIVPDAARGQGSHVMDLDSRLNWINTRALKGLPKDSALSFTNYEADLTREDQGDKVRYRLLRIVNKEDIDIKNWHPDTPINKLKVLESLFLTNEEEYWAGKEKGNLDSISMLLFLLGLFGFMGYMALQDGIIILEIISLIICFFILRGIYKSGIHFSKKPKKEKVKQLLEYKKNIIEGNVKKSSEQMLQLEKDLKTFSYWETLDPQSFEVGLKIYLQKKGFNLDVSKYSGDGGVDLEGKDQNNQNVIIQAKKYSKAIGVSVVREMLGVKNSKENNPRTIIYGLNGYTSGAIQFAKENSIELKSIREDLLN